MAGVYVSVVRFLRSLALYDGWTFCAVVVVHTQQLKHTKTHLVTKSIYVQHKTMRKVSMWRFAAYRWQCVWSDDTIQGWHNPIL